MHRRLIALLLLLALATASSACSSGGPSATFGTPPRPGYMTGALGSAEAVGYVVRESADGGFWAVTDSLPGSESASPPRVLAVLRPGSVDERGYAVLEGRLVWVAGRSSGAASTPRAAPEILVEAIELIGQQ